MFRLATGDSTLVEMHVRTEQAMLELGVAIREAFERYDQLADRLEGFDRRLQAARVECHAGPLSSGYEASPQPVRAAVTVSTSWLRHSRHPRIT